MESEKLISQNKKVEFQASNYEEIFGVDRAEKQKLTFKEELEKRKKRIREVEDLFFNYSRIEDPSLSEEKFRLNLFRLFIEYFCMRQRVPLRDLIGNIERTILVETLSYFEGNQKKAAEFLGIKHTTLNEKIKRYNIRFQKKVF